MEIQQYNTVNKQNSHGLSNLGLLITLLIFMLFCGQSKAENPKTLTSEIQSEWINGLLKGDDMSSVSADYSLALTSQKVGKNSHKSMASNELMQYQRAEKLFIKDLNKLMHLEGSFEQQHQDYLNEKFSKLEQNHNKLVMWLSKLGKINHDSDKNFINNQQVSELLQLINTRWQILENALHQPLSDWNEWTRDGIRFLSAEVNKKTNINAIQPIILRNDRLPYGSRNFSAPTLLFSPEVITTYADENAMAGVANDLISDELVNLTPEIYALAETLEHDYIKIYNFVRQQVTEQYYAGSMKGSQGTLLSYAGNDVDQAALLMALLRASNIPAHFVQGVIEQPVDQVLNGLGLTDVNQVLDALNKAGIAHEPVIEGGAIRAIQKHHTWVSAYVPYAHYRGSANDLNEPVWIPLAPAIKSILFESNPLTYEALELDHSQLIMDYLSASENSLGVSPMTYWQDALSEVYTGNYTALLSEVENTSESLKLMPASLPFKVVATTYEGATLPDSAMHKISIQLNHDIEILNVTMKLPEVSGRRISISYLPATVEDQNIINQAGGMALVPPYLVNLRPVVKVNGKQVETVAESIGMAEIHDLIITLESPAGSVQVERKLLSGTYMSVVLGTQNDDYPLNTESENLISDETKPIRLIHNLGLNYQRAWYQAEFELAAVMNHAVIRPLPSLMLLSPEFKLVHLDAIPILMKVGGVSIDAISKTVDVVSRSGAESSAWKRLSALHGSWLESAVFDSQWSVNAISADKGIRLQQQSDETLLEVTSSNLNQIIATLNHPEYVKQHIIRWVNSGHHALLAGNPFQLEQWQGSVWTIWHPQTGDSGYFISGGYAGGQTSEAPGDWVFDELAQMLSAPYAEGANDDPLSGRNITKIEATDFQYGVVNQMLPLPSQVLVTDAYNRPVVDALVRFEVRNPQAEIETESGFANYLETYTDKTGMAEVNIKLAEQLYSGPFVRVNPDDENLTLLGLVEISASVKTDSGPIFMDENFNHYALPDEPAVIAVNECNWNELEACNRFQSQQEMRAGNIHVVVLDQFNNPVSNVPIQIAAQSPVPQAGINKSNTADGLEYKSQEYQPQDHEVQTSGKAGTLNTSSLTTLEKLIESGVPIEDIKSTVLGRCDTETPAQIAANSCYNKNELNVPGCAKETDVIYSDTSWETFTFYNGKGYPATRFPVKISVAGLEDKLINRYNGFELVPGNFFASGLLVSATDTNGPNGNYFADKPESSVNKTVSPYYLAYESDDTPGGCVFVQYTIGSIESQSTESVTGNAALTIGGSLTDWDVEFALGSEASLNHNIINSDAVVFDGVGSYPGRNLAGWQHNLYSKTVTAEVVNRSPESFVLNADSTTAVRTDFVIEMAPLLYRPADLTAVFYEDDEVVYTYTTLNPVSHSINLSLPVGVPIDVEKQQFIELIFNKDSDFEIKYDKYPLSGIERKLISAVECDDDSGLTGTCGGRIINSEFKSPIRLSTSVDLPNALFCRTEGFDLNLNTASRVTIEANKHDINGVPTSETIVITDNQLLDEGLNNITAYADDFGNHNYSIKITATAEDNGDQEEVYGTLVSTYDLQNALPIGHAIVKGVDLADGSMVYSKQDIALPSPGVDLEFVRTYSSQSRHELGPMGYGWSSNYLSRVIIGNCGQVTVTGADGGSARFKVVGDKFEPLKGYHSSLVFNEDGTFDFFPKGGNRYHYVKMQDRSWWMDYVEDPNGNRLSVELLARSGAPIIRSVTDSVGRRLLFDYEVRNFGIYQHEMLTEVTGPEGITLTLDYDEIGNLKSAQREGDSTDEIMIYSGETSGPSRALLLSVNDQATGAMRSWAYQNTSFQVPDVMADVPDIASIEVTSISETDAGITTFNYTSGLGYNSAADVTQNDQISNYILNHYGSATQITSPAGVKRFVWETDTDVLLTSETDENDRLRTFDYDDFGNVKQENLGGLISYYTYYAADQFDPPHIKDRIKTHTNWRGHVTTYDYDLAGNKITEELNQITTRYTYDEGLVKTITDGRGFVSIITYDEFGHQKSMRNPAGDTSLSTTNSRGQKLTETDANNHTTVYSYDNSDRVISKQLDDRIWTYEYQNGGRTRIETDPNTNTTTYYYDAQGRLTETINADTDSFTYGYDLNGNKTLENDFGGHVTTFEYDDANRLRIKTAPLGKVTTYDYDNVGNVLSETTADRVTTYAYDPNRYFQTSITRKSATGDAVITRTVDGNGNVLTETDPNQNETLFTYDAFDRLLTSSGPLGSGQIVTYDNNGNVETEELFNTTGNQLTVKTYDKANRLSQVTLPEGGIITYTYDGNGNIETETRPGGYSATYNYNNLNLPIEKTINQQTWTLGYDLAGNLKTENWPNVNGGIGNVVTYEYDVLNREISQTDTVGLIQSQTHDADSNLATLTDGNGVTITYGYNALHQRVSEIKPLGRGHSYTYTVFDELLTDTGPAPSGTATITHEVDQLGRRYSSTGPDAYDMTYGFDLNGNLTSQTDSNGNTTTYQVNALNQIYEQTTTGQSGGSGGPFTMLMTHDTIGNVLTQTDFRGIVTEFTYDKDNRQTTMSRAGQLQSTTTYNQAGLPEVTKDARGNNTVHEYNSQYHKTKTLLPENQVIGFTPNAFGDVTFQDNPGPNDITRTYDLRRRLKTEINGAGETTTYEYDLNNNRTAVIKPEGNRWEYDFDAANRLTAVRNVPEAIETIYSYDAADNLKTITDAENKVTTFTYDDRNRKKTKTYPDNSSIEGYTYDANGNLETVSLANGDNFTYDYDALNRQINQSHVSSSETIDVIFTLDGNGNIENVNETINGITSSISTSFDDLDRLTLVNDHYGNILQFTYDNNGNRKILQDPKNSQSTYEYDDLNRLAQAVVTGTGAFDYIYNSAGLLERIEYPNQGKANFTYDNANRIDTIINTQMGVPVTTYDYDFDDNGNRTALTQSNIHNDQVITYAYDQADRMKQVVYPNLTVDYTLDKVGNRVTESSSDGISTVIKTYTHNNRDQITDITDTDGLNVTYQYDDTGNRTQKDHNGTITTFDYSPRQRINAITTDGNTVSYKYDYLGNRIEKTANGQTSLYTYDCTSLLYETNNLGNVIAKYHYGSDRILAETRNGQNNYMFHDALRTPIAITNQDGSIQNRVEYDVWGNRTEQSASDSHPFGFTGYQEDEDTGLYYAKARYYDPVEGVFLREDPLQGDINTPPSLHRYNYAASNPTYYIDPTGLANDTSHYYEALLIGKLVGLNEGQTYAYALGAQIGDEFGHHDAIHNSTGYVAERFIGPVISVLDVTLGSGKRAEKYYNSKNAMMTNNCGAHALCATDPDVVRRAVSNYTLSVAENFAQIGTADHANTDSFYHIEKSTLSTENEMLHSYLEGHLFEWKSTDKAYLYHDTKRKDAFKARARLLFEYTRQQGTQKLKKNDFELALNQMLADLDKQNNSLYENANSLGVPIDIARPEDLISGENEFNSMRRVLAIHGITDVPRTEQHDLDTNIKGLLNKFSHHQLKGIAQETLSDNDYYHKAVLIRTMSKSELIGILNDSFNQAQHKSKEFIYNQVKENKNGSDTVQESEEKPGSEEVSK